MKRLAVLVFMDPEDADNLRMPKGSWHLAQMTDDESIESGDVARQLADALPRACVARAESIARAESLEDIEA